MYCPPQSGGGELAPGLAESPLEELKMATAVQESSGSKVGRHATTVGLAKYAPVETNIKGLGEIEKFRSGCVHASNEHRNLKRVSVENAGAQRGLSAYLLSEKKMWEKNFPAPRPLVLLG